MKKIMNSVLVLIVGVLVISTMSNNVNASDASVKIVKDDNGNKDDLQRVNQGESAYFSIVITNDGTERLTDISVSDPEAPNCSKITSEINNLIANKYGAGREYLDPSEFISYVCEDQNVQSDYTNKAEVEASSQNGNVSDEDESKVIIGTSCEPKILIEKDDNDNKDDTQSVDQGGTATFTIKVSNRGTERLTNISVSDTEAPNCSKSASEINNLIASKYGSGRNYLSPLEFIEYTCTDTNVQSSYTNTAIAKGDGSSKTVEDSDDSNVVVNPNNGVCSSQYNGKILNQIPPVGSLCEKGVESIISGTGTEADPWRWTCNGQNGGTTASCSAKKSISAIQIIKDDNDNNDDTQTIASGGTATFKIKVKNIGNVDLVDVVVTDILAPNCNKTFASLVVGQEEIYTCSIANVTQSFVNVAVVNGKDSNNNNVTDDDNSNVVVTQNPINGECNSQYNGKELENQPTTNLCLNGIASGVIGTGTEADPWRWTCNGQNGGTTANCSAKKKVPASIPAIQIIKDDNDINDGDDTQTIIKGETATFNISVKNIGNVRLTDIVINDPLVSNCSLTSQQTANLINQKYGHTYLEPNESFRYECRQNNVTQGYTNTATVTANYNGQIVNDSDTSVVVVNCPGNTDIEIDKKAKNGSDSQTIRKGDDAYFKITVKNTGTTRIDSVSVDDQEAPSCNLTISQASNLINQKYGHTYLEPNESFDYECKDEDVERSYNNVAVVTGKNNNETDQDSDSTAIIVEGYDRCDASIGDFVWNDRNKNGIQDSGEEGISGVRLKLYHGNDVIKTTTNSQGIYEFDDLCEGEYKVVVAVETLPEGCYQTYDKDGKLDNATSTNLEKGEDYKRADFGYYCPSRTSVVSRGTTSPATGVGVLAGGIATLFASGSALFSLKRSRK